MVNVVLVVKVCSSAVVMMDGMASIARLHLKKIARMARITTKVRLAS